MSPSGRVSLPPRRDGLGSGGGHALDLLLGEFAFGLRANSDGPSGHWRIANRNNGDQIRCVTVDFVSVVGTHVTFSGTADVNGTVQPYTIADDLDPGTESVPVRQTDPRL